MDHRTDAVPCCVPHHEVDLVLQRIAAQVLFVMTKSLFFLARRPPKGRAKSRRTRVSGKLGGGTLGMACVGQ